MEYFEVERPIGDGFCSDDSCPCPPPGTKIPRGSGYLYISQEVIDFRRDARSVQDVQRKLKRLQQQLGVQHIFAGAGTITPILVCEQGARLRKLDLEVAAADAKYWWETGLAPLRATPLAGTEEARRERERLRPEPKPEAKKWWPFGKKNSRLIEVANNWGIGDDTPLLVEQHPDLDKIFSNPNPQPPQRLAEGNRSYWESQDQHSIRNALAIAYLSHPDPQIRKSTIPLVKNYGGTGIAQMLVDLLVDPSNNVRSAAVQAIWERATDPNPDSNSAAFTIRCLRDEIQQTGFVSHMSPQEAMRALQLLRNAQPVRRDDFNKWMVHAWCRSDEELAEHGYELLDIFSKHGTFLDAGTQETGRIGAEIGSVKDRKVLETAIKATLGDKAASELDTVWKDGLRTYIEGLKENGDIDGLVEALSYKEWKLRGMVAEALGDIGDLRVVGALEDILTEAEGLVSGEFSEFLPDSLRTDLSYVRQKVQEALNRIQDRVEVKDDRVRATQSDQTIAAPRPEEVHDSDYEALPQEDSPGVSIVDVAPEDIPSHFENVSSLRRCASCKQEVQPVVIGDKQYCANCGIAWVESQETSPLPEPEGQEEQNLFCPHCENAVIPSVIAGDPHCPDCGARL